MSSTGIDAPLSKGYPDPPPSYSTILPSAPPTITAPSAASHVVINNQMKGVPPGLEYLTQVNQLLVQEKFTSTQGMGRMFIVLNAEGQQIFGSQQEMRCCRPTYDLTLTDTSGRVAMEMTQNCKCSCTEQVMEVSNPSESNIGFISWYFNSFVTHLSVNNAAQEPVLKILGPGLQTCVFGNSTFEIKSRDEQHVVGLIRNENDMFILSFPIDLEVKTKALLLAACFYVNSAIYQQRISVMNKRNSD
ncbi:phospholipid scramblase 3-like isoform 1-T2 [Discoglossus pictus]